MRRLATSGGLPASIVENTAPWEWMGVLQLLSNPGAVRFVDVDGFGANFFHATLNTVTGLIFITPHARLDYEWFAMVGQAPVVDFHLRFFMTDGSIARSEATFTVDVIDIDDTPPQALFFTSGGSVRAGVPGATIGQLGVTDPDTTGGFGFRLTDGDAWQFEVVGNELRLRPGIQLDLLDGPQRNLIIEVTDGRQSSAFNLTVDILPDPAASTQPIDVLIPGLRRMGLEWTAPNGVGGQLPAWEVQDLSQRGGMVRIQALNGEDIWFNRPAWIELTSGYVHFSAQGAAARTWLAYETVFDRAPRLREMQSIAHDKTRGLTEDYLIHWMMNMSPDGRHLAALSTKDFVRQIYDNVVSWSVADSTVNFHAGRIDNGIVTRVDFVKNIMDWRSQFNDFTTEVANGFYVPRPHMMEIGALLRTGMDRRMDENSWWWFFRLEDGSRTLNDLARDITGTPGFQAKWGGFGATDFVQGFYRELTDRALPDVHSRWWADAINAGITSYANFMAAAVAALPVTSPFHQLPAGSTFSDVW